MTALLEVRGLVAGYGPSRVLHGLELDVAAGEAVALLGRNGAGKSTLLKSIIGIVRPQAGRIAFDGRQLGGRASHEIARQGVGYVPEERRVFADLTVAENLEVGRRPPRPDATSWTIDAVLGLFPSLATMLRRPGGRMSGGEQQMLTIARTLMGNPRLLLLDEPSEGLAPLVVAELRRALGELLAAGLTVLLAEQNLRFAAAVARRACVIERGRVVHEAPMPELARDDARRRRLLGL